MKNRANNNEKLDTIIKFIEKTKNGEFAVIDEVYSNMERNEEEAIIVDSLEDYYYSIS
jgi:hypothetical protein